jgi:hypothetical protein
MAGHPVRRVPDGRQQRRGSNVDGMYQQVFHWVRTAYLDAPSRQLTVPLVARSCGVEAEVCAQVLADLVRAGFLERTGSGSYARRRAGEALPGTAEVQRAQR